MSHNILYLALNELLVKVSSRNSFLAALVMVRAKSDVRENHVCVS